MYLNLIADKLRSVPGHNGFYFKNLISKQEAGQNQDDLFLAASVIKLPIFVEILRLASMDLLDMNEKVVIRDDLRVPSCGALYYYTEKDPEVDIRTLCRLMIVISDNTATNALIDYVGLEQLNAGFRTWGLEKTHLERMLFDSEASAQGKENRICPVELGVLLENAWNRELVSPEASDELLEVLLWQQINHKIPGHIGYGTSIAHKTGDDDGISNDVGIVFAREPFVVCYAGNTNDLIGFDNVIRETSKNLFDLCGGPALK